jgi:hypothetical protein
MAFELDIPTEIGGVSAYLDVPGKYLATVVMVYPGMKPPREGDDPDSFNNVIPDGFSVNMEVVAGDQKDKKFTLIFKGKDLSKSKAYNQIANSAQFNFAKACDLFDHRKLVADYLAWEEGGQIGDKPTVKIDEILTDAIGSLVVLEVEIDTYTRRDGKLGKATKLVFDKIYHVDDPRAKGAVLDQKLMDSIPKSNRHDPSFFELPKRKSATGSSASVSLPATRVTDADLDDI